MAIKKKGQDLRQKLKILRQIFWALFSDMIKATPHNPRLTPLHVICLPAFRHITQILLDLRQQACVEFRQSDENLDGASDAQGLCGIALIKLYGEVKHYERFL